MAEESEFLGATQVRRRYGDMSDMTLWRWLNNPEMGFPRPYYFGRLRFWRRSDLEAWEAMQLGARQRDGRDASRGRP